MKTHKLKKSIKYTLGSLLLTGMLGFTPISNAFDGMIGEILPDEAEAMQNANTLTNPTSMSQSGLANVKRKGNVVVIEDNGSGIIIPQSPANLYDLPMSTQISFMPTGSGSEYKVTKTENVAAENPGATLIPVSIDQAFGIPLGQFNYEYDVSFDIPFMGQDFDKIYINWDGSVTFGQPAPNPFVTNSLATFLAGPPSIAAFRTILYITQIDPVGRVYLTEKANPNRLVITWEDVETFQFNSPDGTSYLPLTFQTVIYENGQVDINLVDTPLGPTQPSDFNSIAYNTVVGLSNGDVLSVDELDFSEIMMANSDKDAIFEEYHIRRDYADVDLTRMARIFYKHEEDKYDFLVTYTNFPTAGGNNAFHRGVKNEASGGGIPIFDTSADQGSAGELESFLFMFSAEQFSDSPNTFVAEEPHKFIWGPQNDLYNGQLIGSDPRFDFEIIPGLNATYPEVYTTDVGTGNKFGISHRYKAGLNKTVGPTRDALGRGHGGLRLDSSGVGVVAHEAMHRWVSIRSSQVQGTFIDDLIGRGGAHWIPYIDNRTPDGQFSNTSDPLFSVQQGAVIVELGIRNGKLVELVRDNQGQIIDDSREIIDPLGVFKEMVNTCNNVLDQAAFMTERDQTADGSSALEQYLMGLRTADEVPNFFYVDNVTSARPEWLGLPLDSRNIASSLRERRSLDDIGYCGDRVSLSVADDFIPILGPKTFPYGDEIDTVINGKAIDVKTMAFILVVPHGKSNYKDDLNQVEMMRQQSDYYLNGPLIGNRNAAGQVPGDPDYDPDIPAKFDLRLDPPVH